MKKISPLLLLTAAFFTMAFDCYTASKHLLSARGNYYFSSSSGNDETGNGSINAPYKSISKLNSLFPNLRMGDSVLLKRGDVFNDAALIVSASGSPDNPIVIGAYGNGVKPVISSLYTIQSWTKTGRNIWESEELPILSKSLYIVLENGGNPVGMGRYPNADAANSGYLTIKSFTGLNSFTDENLPSSPNWTGASLVIRNERWITDIDTITNHDTEGHTITHTASHYKPRTTGVGYFIENSSLTLDEQGEWYYNSTAKKLSIYSASMPLNVQVATRDNNITCIGKNYITFRDITSSGCNGNNIDSKGNYNNHILNCSIINSGNTAIKLGGTKKTIIKNNDIINSLSNGIEYGYNCTNGIISGNLVKNTSLIPGLGQNNDGQGNSLNILSRNLLVEYNHLSNAGYCNIWLTATSHGITTDSITVQYNEIDSFNRNKNDGAGIYLTGLSGVPQYGRVFRHNYVHDGFTSLDGTNPQYNITYGIYFDAFKVGAVTDSNFFSNCGRAAVFVNSHANDISFNGNIFYNNPVCQVDMVISRASDPLNLTFNNNIFWSNGNQSHWRLSSDDSYNLSSVSLNNNYYINSDINTAPFRYGKAFAYTSYNFSKWNGNAAIEKNAIHTAFSNSDEVVSKFNTTRLPVSISLPGKWKDALGNSFSNSNPLILQPYTGIILMKEK